MMMKKKFALPKKVHISRRNWLKREIKNSPRWCAVDLRDGNQALPNPMTPEQKRAYFELLCKIGFKEIEVGFPSASLDDYQFTRDLIERSWIPDDVTISVLLQAREEQVRKTVASLKGVKRVVIHFYIATSDLHRKYVFHKTREEQIQMGIQTARLIRELSAMELSSSRVGLEFSPEEFSDTDLDYSLDICEAIVEAWNPQGDEKVILNLPVTVERRIPTDYADMIEEFSRRLKVRDKVVISIHNHNDMGMAVSAALLAIKAGAERVEGTLLGHGERTGNVDLVTLALNLEYLGVSTGLDFSDLPKLVDQVESITGMPVHPRHPYAGELVFTAFSGSHQDAIHKGFHQQEEIQKEFGGYKMPYLHIDPAMIGRQLEKFIRINSQSGKGGIAHIMERDFQIVMPRWVQIDFMHHVQEYADTVKREISAEELWDIFQRTYKYQDGPLVIKKYWPRPIFENPEEIEAEIEGTFYEKPFNIKEQGNGPISAFVHAIKKIPGIPPFILVEYAEGNRGVTADAEAVCFIALEEQIHKFRKIGVGIANNIDQAASRAVVAAVNAILRELNHTPQC